MKNIKVKLTNGDLLEFIGKESNEGGAYVVTTSESITTILGQHILWVSVSGYIEEKVEGNVVHVDFKGTNK